MKQGLHSIKIIILEAIRDAGFEIEESEMRLERCKNAGHGHYATNTALLLAGKLGKRPMEVAQSIMDELKKSKIFTRVEVAAPGFVNVEIEQKFYSRIVESLLKNPKEWVSDDLELKEKSKKIVIEYSSPNIAKPLGAHHILSTIIGESLKRILKRVGNEVIAENYPGDIGTQFGKLIYAIREWGDTEVIEKNPIDELLKLYVRFHEEAERNPELEDSGRAEYKKFEEGDKESRVLWKKIVDWSFSEIEPMYKRLGVSYDAVHGESFFEERMVKLLKKGRDEGIFVDGENGAWIVMPDEPNDPPALARKSDGTTLYLTRDLAQMEFFEEHYHPDEMIWVVDVAQSLHFRQRFSTARKMNLTSAKTTHVEFGRMQFKGGGMSTRKGNIVRLTEVLDEAQARSVSLIEEKGADLTEAEKNELAVQMGASSVKYNILHQNRIQNITFDWDQMLSLDGNSAPYLMYTIARAKSILRKAEVSHKDLQGFTCEANTPDEVKVLLDILDYASALKRASEEYKPNHIANFLYQLAKDFNTFYNSQPVLQAGDKKVKESRLMLTGAVITVMEDTFSLLGLSVPEKM